MALRARVSVGVMVLQCGCRESETGLYSSACLKLETWGIAGDGAGFSVLACGSGDVPLGGFLSRREADPLFLLIQFSSTWK